MNEIPPYYIFNEDGSPNTSKRNPKGLVYSKKFIDSFFSNKSIKLNYDNQENRIKCIEKYVRDLYFQIEQYHSIHGDWSKTYENYYLFKETYPSELRYQTREYFVDFLIENSKYEEALNEWETTYNWQGTFNDYDIERLIQFEMLLKRPIINGYHIYCMAPIDNQLTSFGKNNKKEVLKAVEIIIKNEFSNQFISRFFKELSFDNNKRITFPKERYIQYFEPFKKFNFYKNRINITSPNQFSKKNGTANNQLIYLAMRSESSRLLREGENEYRLMIGAKKIGESWISETELFYKLKTAFSNLEVVHHGKPKWLNRQHFDIWFPNHNIAIEYQGVQHDRPIDYFGGNDAFECNKIRDDLKKEKCRSYGCTLIEVRPNYDINEIIIKINELLYLSNVTS